MSMSSFSKSSLPLRTLYLGISAILVLVPFHALLSTWASSNLGYADIFRAWKEILLLVLAVICLWQLARSGEVFRSLLGERLVQVVLAYVVLTLIMFFFGLVRGNVGLEAALFGLLNNTRGVVFFLIVYSGMRLGLPNFPWRKLLFIPAALVVGFGLLQMSVLPDNFLTHFGYGPESIQAFQTIDNKADYARVQSALRGPNPLGVYLLLVLAGISACCMKEKSRRVGYAIFGAASLLVLYGTYSRSAWIGSILAVGLVCFWSIKNTRIRHLLLVVAAIAALAFVSGVYAMRNNDTVQNIFFHTDENSTSANSSNEERSNALTNGLRDIAKNPLGSGVGSAGPASYRNTEAQEKIPENYFIQVGQETGVVGLALFVAVSLGIAYRLWLRRTDSLALAMLAALIGISVVNLLSHAWTDDTIAYLWFGLSAIAVGHGLKAGPKKKRS
jgi:O-antigen ligase